MRLWDCLELGWFNGDLLVNLQLAAAPARSFWIAEAGFLTDNFGITNLKTRLVGRCLLADSAALLLWSGRGALRVFVLSLPLTGAQAHQ